MFKYEYVSLKLANNVVKDAKLSGHRQIIDDYAKNGYRFVGIIPTKFGPSGKTVEIELIFESVN